ADEARLVVRDVDVLGRPRLVRTIRHEAGTKSGNLEEIEARAERAGHGENRATVTLARAEAWLIEGVPHLARLTCELDRSAMAGTAARCDGVTVTKLPRERELSRRSVVRRGSRTPRTSGGEHDHEETDGTRLPHGAHRVGPAADRQATPDRTGIPRAAKA